MARTLPKPISNLIVRALTTVCLVGGILHIIWKMPPVAFTFVVVLFVCAALYEFFTLSAHMNIAVARSVAIPCGILIALSPSFFWDELLLVGSVLTLFIYQFTKREERPLTLVPVAVSLLGWVYIAWFLSFFNKIRFLPEGNVWLCFALFVAKAGDIGAYAVGSRWGNKPLIPRISPKKSIEGAVGGFLASLTVAVLFALATQTVSLSHALVLGVLIGIFAQLGDLSESLIKREAGVKDSGTWMPGLGGILDLLDSLLFTAPLVYLYLILVIFR